VGSKHGSILSGNFPLSGSVLSGNQHEVDPQAWLAYVLAKLPDYLAKQTDELLPWNWKASQGQIKAAA
jgi:transposase